MIKFHRLFIGIIALVVLFTGCISNSSKSTEQVNTTPAISPTPAQTLQSVEHAVKQNNKILEWEDRINTLQQQVNDLQTRLEIVGLPKPGNKSLIPQVPFRLEVYTSEMRTPVSWTFKESEVEIKEEGSSESASYIIYRNNNTIKINSKKYDFFGIVLYDDYVTAISQNGWIVWGKKYKINQKYNPLTQKYEVD